MIRLSKWRYKWRKLCLFDLFWEECLYHTIPQRGKRSHSQRIVHAARQLVGGAPYRDCTSDFLWCDSKAPGIIFHSTDLRC